MSSLYIKSYKSNKSPHEERGVTLGYISSDEYLMDWCKECTIPLYEALKCPWKIHGPSSRPPTLLPRRSSPLWDNSRSSDSDRFVRSGDLFHLEIQRFRAACGRFPGRQIFLVGRQWHRGKGGRHLRCWTERWYMLRPCYHILLSPPSSETLSVWVCPFVFHIHNRVSVCLPAFASVSHLHPLVWFPPYQSQVNDPPNERI